MKYGSKDPAFKIEVQALITNLPETQVTSDQWSDAESILKWRLQDTEIWRDYL